MFGRKAGKEAAKFSSGASAPRKEDGSSLEL